MEGVVRWRSRWSSRARARSSRAWPTRGTRIRPAERVLAEASEAMGRDVVDGCHDPEALATTEFVQPALLACDVAAFRVLEAEGGSPTWRAPPVTPWASSLRSWPPAPCCCPKPWAWSSSGARRCSARARSDPAP